MTIEGWRKAAVALAGLALGGWLQSRGQLTGDTVTLIVGCVGAFAGGNAIEHLMRPKTRDEQPKAPVDHDA
jgi:uncharacterized membrane protein YeaQ/YmgE (transglycosylase-associated protein family)